MEATSQQYEPIETKWLKGNQKFSLGWDSGEKDRLAWTFHRVISYETTRIGPFSTGLGFLAYGADLTSVVLQNADNQKIFDVTENEAAKQIFHVGVGVRPSVEQLRIYPEYPSGRRLGQVPALDPIRVGKDFGYKTGRDSPFHTPSEALEFMFPFGVDAAFSVRNLDEQRAEVHVSFNILMRKYLMKVLDPRQEPAIVAALARGPPRGIPCYFFPVGPLENPFPFPASTGTRWDNVKPITLENAIALDSGVAGRRR